MKSTHTFLTLEELRVCDSCENRFQIITILGSSREADDHVWYDCEIMIKVQQMLVMYTAKS